MKNFVILYDQPDWELNQPFSSDRYDSLDLRMGYEQLAKQAREKGLQQYRASVEWYEGDGRFKQGWCFDDGWRKVEAFRADVVYDKTPYRGAFIEAKKRIAKEVPMLNDPELDEICSDKQRTYELFGEFMPTSEVVSSRQELEQVVSQQIDTDQVVLKPLAGSSAKGVRLVETENLPETIKQETLVQEYVDTESGIPGFINGVGDLRTIICDGTLVNAYIRESKEGEWISNLSHGATRLFVALEEIPEPVKLLLHKIDGQLERFSSRLYTADFIFNPEGEPILLEMNSKPIFDYFDYEKHSELKRLRRFNDAFLDSLLRLIT